MSDNPYREKWRLAMKKRSRLDDEIIAEMEDHLTDAAEELMGAGLYEDEAWLIAIKRLGSQSELTGEMGDVHRERLYRELLAFSGKEDRSADRKSVLMMILLAAGAALASRVPGLVTGNFTLDNPVLFTNASVIILPFAALLFLSFGKSSPGRVLIVAALAAAAFLALNFYPVGRDGQSRTIMDLHGPLMLWLLLSIIFPSGREDTAGRTIHYLRFTGESFLYAVLFLLGYGVLFMLTSGLFDAAGFHTARIINRIFPAGLFAAPLIGAWLAEKKRNIIENLAPVLAKLFIPLFLILIAIFLAVTLVTGRFYIESREFLIVLDAMLFLVTAMSFYEISSRGGSTEAGISDYMNLALMAAVLLADLLALGNIAFRLSEFGLSLNKVTALAENILLAVNLVALGILYAGFFRKKRSFDSLIVFQGRYMAAYFIWSIAALFLLPALFRFI